MSEWIDPEQLEPLKPEEVRHLGSFPYLQTEVQRMGEELKPERCHVVFSMPYDDHTIVANCDPRAPDAWRAPHVIEMLHFLARALCICLA